MIILKSLMFRNPAPEMEEELPPEAESTETPEKKKAENAETEKIPVQEKKSVKEPTEGLPAVPVAENAHEELAAIAAPEVPERAENGNGDSRSNRRVRISPLSFPEENPEQLPRSKTEPAILESAGNTQMIQVLEKINSMLEQIAESAENCSRKLDSGDENDLKYN